MRTDTFRRINGRKKNVVVVIAVLIATAMLLSVSFAWFANELKTKATISSVAYNNLDVKVTNSAAEAISPDGQGIYPLAALTAGMADNAVTVELQNKDMQRTSSYRLAFLLEQTPGDSAATETELMNDYAEVQNSITTTVTPHDGGVLTTSFDALYKSGLYQKLNVGAGESYRCEFGIASSSIDSAVFSRASYRIVMLVQTFGMGGNTHFISTKEEFKNLLSGNAVNGAALENGDTVVLVNDIVTDAAISGVKAFNLFLAGHTLTLGGDLTLTVPDSYFGTMDFAATGASRNEFFGVQARKGRIVGAKKISITARNVALRSYDASSAATGCINDEVTWTDLHCRLVNGVKTDTPSGPAVLSLQMLRAVPLSRDYNDVQMTSEFIGEGTVWNPYLITSLGDYKKLEYDINNRFVECGGYAGKYFRLATDLDFTPFSEIPSIGGMTLLVDEPIPNAFKGYFDGDGHRLIGLKINGQTYSNVGVFGIVDGGTVQNLIKSGGYIAATGTNIGGIVGRATNGATIRACYQTSPVCGNRVDDTVGGIVGSLENGSQVLSCYNLGTVNKPFDAKRIAQDEFNAMLARQNEEENLELDPVANSVDHSGDPLLLDEAPAVGGEMNENEPEEKTVDSSAELGEEPVSPDSSAESSDSGSEGTPSGDGSEPTSSAPESIGSSSELTVSDGENSSDVPSDLAGESEPSSGEEKETSSEPEKPNDPSNGAVEPGANVIDPFEGIDLSSLETTEAAGKLIGSIVGANDGSSYVKYCYGLLDSCPNAIGTEPIGLEEGVPEPQNTTVFLKSANELRSPSVVDMLNLGAPGFFRAGLGAYAFPWLTRQTTAPEGFSLPGKTVRVSAVSTDFDLIEPEEFTQAGNISDPYIIETAGQYKYLVQSVMESQTFYTSYFKLGANFDFTGVENVLPIGGSGLPFSGHFDGKGHSIIGMTVSGRINLYVGVFGNIENAEIRNLGVESGTFTGNMYVGAIAGWATDSMITGCFNSSAVMIENGEVAGGIVGYNAGSRISGCYNVGSVSAPQAAGGIVGYNEETSRVGYCYSLDTACDLAIGIDWADPSLTDDDFITTSDAVMVTVSDPLGEAISNSSATETPPAEWFTQAVRLYDLTDGTVSQPPDNANPSVNSTTEIPSTSSSSYEGSAGSSQEPEASSSNELESTNNGSEKPVSSSGEEPVESGLQPAESNPASGPSPSGEPNLLQLTVQRLTHEQMLSRKFVALLNLHADNAFTFIAGRYPGLTVQE